MGASVSQHAVIDEVEGDIFVVLFDEGPKLLLSRKMLPLGIGEGTVLKVTWEVDDEEKKRRVDRIQTLQEKLLKRSGKK